LGIGSPRLCSWLPVRLSDWRIAGSAEFTRVANPPKH
jgi:hypothetical protein